MSMLPMRRGTMMFAAIPESAFGIRCKALTVGERLAKLAMNSYVCHVNIMTFYNRVAELTTPQ